MYCNACNSPMTVVGESHGESGMTHWICETCLETDSETREVSL